MSLFSREEYINNYIYVFLKSMQNIMKFIWICVDANLGQHTNALDRAARERARCSSLYVERSDRYEESVRPVAGENR